WLSTGEIHSLARELVKNLALRAHRFDRLTLRQIEFSLKVSDIREDPYFVIDMRSGAPTVRRSSSPSSRSILLIEIPSRILRHSFASDWGGDAVTIGYGCEVHAFRPETILANLDVICVQLLTRIPSATRHWKSEPLRMARYLVSGSITRAWA